MSVKPAASRRRARSPWRLSNLLPALAVAAVVAFALWVKGDSLKAALGWQRPTDDAERLAKDSTEAGADEDFPTEVKLASARVARQMGIELAAVDSRPLSHTITCNGRAAFNQNHYAQIRSRVEGIVRRIAADVGQQVEAGQSLAVVDSPRLGDIKAGYLNALTRRGQLEWEYDRLKQLADQQAVPVKTYRDAQSLFEQQQTTTANDRQQLVNLGFSADEIDRLAAAKDTTTELPLTAPWTGTVVSRSAVEGELVDRNAPMFALADLNTLWVYLNLYESDIGRVQIGQTVEFEADGLEAACFVGRIDWISPEVDRHTRITQVRAEVANVDHALRANMFGKGRIVIEASHDGLVVPELAVQTYRERPVVFVRETDDRFAVRPIEIGIKGERYWEILSGADRGEEVATTGSFLLKSELEKDKLGEAD